MGRAGGACGSSMEPVFHMATKSSGKEMREMEHIVGSPVWGFVLCFQFGPCGWHVYSVLFPLCVCVCKSGIDSYVACKLNS